MWKLAIPIWEFVLRGAIVYIFLLVLLRVTGKRQIGQRCARGHSGEQRLDHRAADPFQTMRPASSVKSARDKQPEWRHPWHSASSCLARRSGPAMSSRPQPGYALQPPIHPIGCRPEPNSRVLCRCQGPGPVAGPRLNVVISDALDPNSSAACRPTGTGRSFEAILALQVLLSPGTE